MKIFVAGHRGMVGAALVRRLLRGGYHRSQVVVRSRDQLDLTNQAAVDRFFSAEGIDQVYLAAAKVGGIYANNVYPAQFIYENLMIEANVIHSAFSHGVRKILFLGSSCIYPKYADQPMRESALLTGPLEPTNEPYAVAKIAGIKLCESYNRQYGEAHGVDYRSVMPTNLYGPGDSYHPDNSHVVPALIRRFHEAKVANSPMVTIWGSGRPRREFLHVDDLASACVHLMSKSKVEYKKVTEPMQSHINIGSGQELCIRELAEMICQVVGYSGKISFDTSKLDGSPRKLMNSDIMKSLGWKPLIELREGIGSAYEDYLSRYSNN